jgi:Mg/Co/Ni transporter MgtE
MTRQYDIVLPLMLACITANYLALPYGVSMYADSLKRAPRTLLPGLSLVDMLTPGVPPKLREQATLDTIKQRFEEIPYNHIHVVGEGGRWLGIIGRKALSGAPPEALARDLIRPDSRYLESSMTLQQALQVASEVPSELLPVVEVGTSKFLGTISKSDLLAVLQKGWRAPRE